MLTTSVRMRGKVGAASDRVWRVSFPASPSASCLQSPNTSACCTRRGAYAGNFCAKGRYLCSAARCRHWLPYEKSRDGNDRWRNMTITTNDRVWRDRFPGLSFRFLTEVLSTAALPLTRLCEIRFCKCLPVQLLKYSNLKQSATAGNDRYCAWRL